MKQALSLVNSGTLNAGAHDKALKDVHCYYTKSTTDN